MIKNKAKFQADDEFSHALEVKLCLFSETCSGYMKLCGDFVNYYPITKDYGLTLKLRRCQPRETRSTIDPVCVT